MNNVVFIRLLVCAFFLSVNFHAFAIEDNASVNSTDKLKLKLVSSSADSIGKGREKGDKKEGKEKEIKEVPKSRRQDKPEAIKPPVKVKPVKVAKPKPVKVNFRKH
ncbi:hypothetical protein C3K47_13315 [Solitalea longa]|uniref:Uncharacterized protein n=1 Tax=Solitalea longa TaxID=2079460 RepID=A0A2S4ZZL4_9SPHI|nr:hypothetical protein [Solitalea longa]POY35734.1 hypothetical protein C3K47_13315 [Solitalea longa]